MTAQGVPIDDEEEEGPGLLNHLPAILWQRRWLFLIPFVLLSLAGVAAALLLPTVYRSSAVLLVESQELPPDLVGSPVTALIDQRIAKIRQQVLSRGDLIELIQQNDLYEEERQTEPLSQVIEKMRAATNVAAVSADIGQGPGRGNTIAFSMSFDYHEAQKAQLVMQRFVERFLEIDATQMSEQATSTVAFLEEQATRLQQQIADLEGQITSIKAANGAALATTGMLTISNPGSFDAEIASLQRENVQLRRQSRDQAKSPAVAAAEAQLANARAVYTESHPDVVFAKQRLEEARRLAAASPANDDNLAAAAQIEANNARIAALGRECSEQASRASAAVAAQSRAPVVMEQVSQLEDRADTLRTQYQGVATKLLAAQSSARMEAEQKGERLSVTDPPVVPEEPLSPNRPLLVLGGIAAGALAGFGLVLLIELMLRPIRGVSQIERLLGSPPLVVVPTLRAAPRFTDRLMFWKRGTST